MRLRWLSWVGYIPGWYAHPKMVTHPSTNQAQCRVTMLPLTPNCQFSNAVLYQDSWSRFLWGLHQSGQFSISYCQNIHKQEALLGQRDHMTCLAVQKNLQSMNDLDIHPKSSKVAANKWPYGILLPICFWPWFFCMRVDLDLGWIAWGFRSRSRSIDEKLWEREGQKALDRHPDMPELVQKNPRWTQNVM